LATYFALGDSDPNTGPTPSAVALLEEVRARLVAHTSCSTAIPDPWALLGMAAEDIEASARAEISAGNALNMALGADPPCLLAAVDLALSFERSRQLAVDTWLASRLGAA